MDQDRDTRLRAHHALTDEEINTAVERCPEELRWAFSGWLRGERRLDGDLIELPDC